MSYATVWTLAFSLLALSQCADICSSITNLDCACVAPNISIRCNLTSRPVLPIFNPLSLSAPLTLNTVDLSGLNLTELPLDFFPGNNMTTIRRLQLNDNLLSAIPQALTSLASLTELEMGHNQVASLSLAALQTVAGLESLSLPYNRLTHLAFQEGTNPPSTTSLRLKNLTLAANEIISIDRGLFAAMPHLTVLDLSHNRLTQLSNTDFAYLDLSLVVLDLSHNDLDEIAPLALQNLHHLRTLSLEHNRLRDLSSLHLPAHLRSLDLSHCALTIIDHCQVSGMADLTYLGLNGNDLTCTCQLYLLLQWYQNIHHMAGDPDSTKRGRLWTCTNTSQAATPTSPQSPSHPDTTLLPFAHHSPLGTDAPSDFVRFVMSMTECRDIESHCQTLEHAEHHDKGSSQMTVSLNVATSDETLLASWTYEENGETIVQGFRLRYIPEDNEPVTSPIIAVDQRSYTIKTTGLEQHYMVCLDIVSPENTVIDQECVNVKGESSNVIAGILAGVVFLVPCIIATFYVVLKDHRIKKSLARGYQAMAVDEKDLEKNPDESEEENGNASCMFKPNLHSSGSKGTMKSGNNVKISSTQSQDEVRQEKEALPAYGTLSAATRQANYSSLLTATAAQSSNVHIQQEVGAEDKATILASSHQNRLTHSTPENVPSSVSLGTVNAGFQCSEGDECNNDNHSSTHL